MFQDKLQGVPGYTTGLFKETLQGVPGYTTGCSRIHYRVF